MQHNDDPNKNAHFSEEEAVPPVPLSEDTQALFLACQKGLTDTVKALLTSGKKVDVCARDKEGKTPLNYLHQWAKFIAGACTKDQCQTLIDAYNVLIAREAKAHFHDQDISFARSL